MISKRFFVKAMRRTQGSPGLNQEIYGLKENNSIWFKDDKVFVPGGARRKIMESGHANPIAGQFGIKKSTEYIGRQYWWPTMLTNVTNSVREFVVCQRSKPSQSRPGGLLQPLPIPKRRWILVCMDFITGLPLTIRGKNCILVFVDRFSKMVHFVPTVEKVTAKDFARLFIDTVVKHHGVPDELISDRDPKFKAVFTQEFLASLGVT